MSYLPTPTVVSELVVRYFKGFLGSFFGSTVSLATTGDKSVKREIEIANHLLSRPV